MSDGSESMREKRLQEYRNILACQPALAHALEKTMVHMPVAPFHEYLYLHVFAPAAVAFVCWVLEEAQKNGIKRLYFLARDGYPFYCIARKICSVRQWDMECRYLKVSRYSLRTAQYHLPGEDALTYICGGGMDVTLEKIMRRAGLTWEESLRIVELLGRRDQYQKKLLPSELRQIKEDLRGLPEFVEPVKLHSRERYPDTVGYLAQEGLFEDIPCGIVDSGWIGTIQKSIDSLIRSADAAGRVKTPEGYYFGLYEIPRDADRRKYHGFYFEPAGQIGRKAHFANCLFEAVYSAPEGMTMGYRHLGDGYEPVEDVRINPNRAELAGNLRLLFRYAENFLKQSPVSVPEQAQEMIERLFGKIMSHPTPEEVNAFGSYLFCDDMAGEGVYRVAGDLTDQEIRNQFLFRKALRAAGLKKESGNGRESAWIEGSIVQNGTKVRKNLRHALWYKYLSYMGRAVRQ